MWQIARTFHFSICYLFTIFRLEQKEAHLSQLSWHFEGVKNSASAPIRAGAKIKSLFFPCAVSMINWENALSPRPSSAVFLVTLFNQALSKTCGFQQRGRWTDSCIESGWSDIAGAMFPGTATVMIAISWLALLGAQVKRLLSLVHSTLFDSICWASPIFYYRVEIIGIKKLTYTKKCFRITKNVR